MFTGKERDAESGLDYFGASSDDFLEDAGRDENSVERVAVRPIVSMSAVEIERQFVPVERG